MTDKIECVDAAVVQNDTARTIIFKKQKYCFYNRKVNLSNRETPIEHTCKISRNQVN